VQQVWEGGGGSEGGIRRWAINTLESGAADWSEQQSDS